jgi:hypothetical protein
MAGRAPVVPKKAKMKPVVLEEQIRQRAHAIYLERGSMEGSELDDWLRAEQEIMSSQSPETSGHR